MIDRQTLKYARLGLALTIGALIGLGGANRMAYAEDPPDPTCPTKPPPVPENIVGYGCSNHCSPGPTGCCEYATYVDSFGNTQTWRKCNMVLYCSNPLGTPNGYNCNTTPP